MRHFQVKKSSGPTYMRILNTAQAVREAHELILSESPDNIVIGEGVPDPKACFGTTQGLIEKFPHQIFDSPLSENGVMGICAGAAISGINPIFIHMRQDFLLYSFDQIVNNIAKWHSMFGGNGGNPAFTIKAFTGRGWGSGHQHSQNLESLFAHIPGLKVLVPSGPYNAKGLLIAASHSQKPCIILEDRWVHPLREEVPEGCYEVEIDRPVCRRQGRGGTVIAWGRMLSEALHAADYLKSSSGTELQVIDLQTLSFECVERARDLVTSTKVLIVENAWHMASLGCSVGTLVATRPEINVVSNLSLDMHYPSSTPALNKHYYPTYLNVIEWALGEEQNSRPRPDIHDIPDKSFTGPF